MYVVMNQGQIASTDGKAGSANKLGSNISQTNMDFMALLLNGIQPGQSPAMVDNNGHIQNGASQKPNTGQGQMNNQTLQMGGQAALSPDSMSQLNLMVQDMVSQGLLPENFDAQDLSQSLDSVQFGLIDMNPQALEHLQASDIGLSQALIFNNDNGVAEAAFIQDGKIQIAPLADLMSGEQPGISFQKMISPKQAMQSVISQTPGAQEQNGLHLGQTGLPAEAMMMDGDLRPVYEWRLSLQQLQNSTSPIALQSALQNNANANASANLIMVGAQAQNLAQNSASQAGLPNLGAGLFDVSGFLNEPLAKFNDGFGGSDFQGQQFIEQSLDPDQLIREGHNKRDVSSFANLLSGGSSAQKSANGKAPALTDQIAMNIQKGANGKLDKITLQLDPQELGKMDIEFNISEDGKTKALILAEKPETLNMLRQDAKAIESILAEAGLEMDQNSLEFDLKGGEAFNNQDQNQNNNKSNANGFDEALDGAGGDVADLGSGDATILLSAEAILSADRVNIVV